MIPPMQSDDEHENENEDDDGVGEYPDSGEDLVGEGPAEPLSAAALRGIMEDFALRDALHVSLAVEAAGLDAPALRTLASELAERIRDADPCQDAVADLEAGCGAEEGTRVIRAAVGPTAWDPAAPETAFAAAQDAVSEQGWGPVAVDGEDGERCLAAVWRAPEPTAESSVRVHLHVATGWTLTSKCAGH